jgi:hypothetical protein
MVGNTRALLDTTMIINLNVSATVECSDVFLEICVDNDTVFKTAATTQPQTISCFVKEDPANHVLKLVMSGKTKYHTKINEQGEITYDVAFLVNRLEFEDIDMTPVFYHNNSCYTHNLNGSATERVDEFSGFMGCNGTVDFKFSTPIYLWMYQKI